MVRRSPKKSSSASPRGPRTERGSFRGLSLVKKLGFLAVALLVLLPPIVVLPGFDDNFRLPKLLLSELLALSSLLLLSLRVWRHRQLRMTAIVRHPVVMAMVPLVAAVSLGWFTTDHAAVVHRALPSFWIGVAALVGWTLALESHERTRLLRLMLLPAGLLALLSVLQVHQIFDPFTFLDRVTDRTRLTSLAGGAFDLSGYLVLPLLVLQDALYGELKTRRRRVWLVMYGVGLALGFYAVLGTRTLTSILSLGVGTLLLWRSRTPRRRFFGGLAIAAVLAIVAISVGPLQSRMGNIQRGIADGEANRLLTGRLDAWRGALHMLGEHPLVGVGHGAFRAEYGQAREALRSDGVTFFKGQSQVFFTNAHSDILDSLAEWGVLGGAALVWALLIFVRGLRQRWRRVNAEGRTSPEAGLSTRPDVGIDVGVSDPRPLEQAGLGALLVLMLTYFPLHLGLQSYPWLLFASGLWTTRLTQDAAEHEPLRGAQP